MTSKEQNQGLSKKNIHELSRKIDMPEEKVEKILEEVSKPSLTNTHCSFDDESGVGPSYKEIEKELKELTTFLSKKSGLPEKEVEARIREDLKALLKPCLHNMDTPGKFKLESMF